MSAAEKSARPLSLIRELAGHLIFCVLFPLLLLFLSQAVTMQDFDAAWRWLLAHGESALFFWLFFAAAQLLLRVLLGGYALPTLLCSAFAALLTLVNYYKTLINGFPLMLSDLSLLPSFGDVAAYAMPQISLSAVTKRALALFALPTALAPFFRTRVPKKRCSPAAMALLSLSLPLLVCFFGSSVLLDRIAALTADCASQEERLERCGPILGLYAAYAAGENEDYSAYDSDTLNRLQNALYLSQRQNGENASAEGAVRPHILMFLSESFFDVTRLESIDFSSDPLPNFHALGETCTNGRFLSSTYAGGTGNVELETLTGLSGSLLRESDALTALYRRDGDIYRNIPSVVRDARGSGYQTFYIHSHNSALYRRAAVMPSLGFDTVVFSDDFETPVNFSGSYVSDDTLVNEVIRRFERREPGSPVFMQITSMENHQPYNAGKYPGAQEPDFTCNSLSDGEREVLGALVTGLNHADAALGRLVDYFSDCGEPVMLVFYGDHLPSMILSDASTLYSTLGSVSTVDSLQWSADELMEMLSTDYLIWTNYESSPAPDHTESSVLLGANALARAGLRRSSYFHWLSETVGGSYLLFRPRLLVAADGSAHSDVPEGCVQTLDAQRTMQYDLIYGEQRLLKYFCLER